MKTYPIIFAGAGPGDPELVTVKAQKALAAADLIVYAGSLVPEAVLTWTRPDAQRISSAGMHLDEIITTMTTAHADGRRVVRLHTGDPSLYGAIFEQMAALQKQDIAYEVIPGVTAAFAAAAALGIEYTLPEISQTLILTRMAGRTPVPEAENLETLARHRASMAIYLSINLVEAVAAILKRCYGDTAPCVIAYKVSHPDQKLLRTRLDRLVQTVKQENITRQALIIVGQTLCVHEEKLVHKSKLYDQTFRHGFRK